MPSFQILCDLPMYVEMATMQDADIVATAAGARKERLSSRYSNHMAIPSSIGTAQISCKFSNPTQMVSVWVTEVSLDFTVMRGEQH